MLMRKEQVIHAFEKYYHQNPSAVIAAPARVNLIGEHTDYNQGFVLPCAINCFTWVAIAPRDDENIHIHALNFDEHDEYTLDQPFPFSPTIKWYHYTRGVISALQSRSLPISGINCTIGGNIPQGAGLSSSASLEVALLKALNTIFQLNLSTTEIAQIGQHAENHFVGCQCGIMDQLIISNATQQHALLIDCQNLHTTAIKVPESLTLLVIHSGIERSLASSEYNTRREQCQKATQAMNLNSLRDADLSGLSTYEAILDPILFRRARYIITENQRTLSASDALEQGDCKTLFQLMFNAHQSMRDDFQVTLPAIDFLVDNLQAELEDQGGVRMTGGGFGGCIIVLAKKERIQTLGQQVFEKYSKRYHLNPWQRVFQISGIESD